MDTTAINWEMSLKQVGGRAKLAEELINMFVNELPITQKSINSAVKTKHYQKLRDILHKLDGGCAYAGVPGLKKIIAELSSVLKDPKQMNKLDDLIASLNNEIDAILKVASTKSYLPQ